MFIAKKVLFLTIVCATASIMAADLSDDAIKLSSSGVNEDVIVAWAQQQHGFQVTPENIIALKDHKVSDRVILALIKGAENVPLSVATLKSVRDRNWIQRSQVIAPQQIAEEPTPEQIVDTAPATTYTAQSTAYVVPSSVTYASSGYCSPYSYGGYYGYPYYYGGYYGYPYVGLGLSFNFGDHFGHGFHGGGFGGGFHSGGFGGGFHGGSGFVAGGGFRGGRR